MSEHQAERIGDAQLTNINITAATPDVLNRVCTEICDSVMQQIPKETFEKIAAEVIASGKVVHKRKTGPHYACRTEEVEVTIADEVKRQLGDRLIKVTKGLVEDYFKQPEVGELIKELATSAFTQCLADLPKLLTANFCSKVLGAVNGNQAQVIDDLVAHAQISGGTLENIRQTLMDQTHLNIGFNNDDTATWYLGQERDDGQPKKDQA